MTIQRSKHGFEIPAVLQVFSVIRLRNGWFTPFSSTTHRRLETPTNRDGSRKNTLKKDCRLKDGVKPRRPNPQTRVVRGFFTPQN
jgi:hypothetical protein